jgi:hypothetical protein
MSTASLTSNSVIVVAIANIWFRIVGDALLFFSHTPSLNVDPHSLHGGSPVVRGTKYSATKWMRINRYQQ